jgi:hypothetical protein
VGQLFSLRTRFTHDRDQVDFTTLKGRLSGIRTS